MAKEMLINTVAGQECRIAIVEDGRLDELYIERASSASHVGNIYKGKIVNVEPAIQAAFVDFGLGKHGFLHISDVQPQYFPKGKKISVEDVGRKHPHHQRPPIQECLRRGQEVVVQMTKEGIGTKGPTMTTYLSLPGRLVVMMPGMNRLGISRKIEDEDARHRARQALGDLKLPPDMGFIIRTAGVGRAKRDLQRDLNYLLRLWNTIKKHIASAKAPAEIYQESDLVTRTIRDIYNRDIDRIICDDEAVARQVREFLRVAMPRTKHRIEVYLGAEGLFHDYGLEDEIEKIYSRRVELPSGGSLVIDQTEALVAIDVNSGRYREHTNAETTALKTNLEAAKEIARQLRLRDLGGVIVIDFIDMREQRNRRSVEKAFREAMKSDRAKTRVQRINSFGIIEMTRQRIRPSLKDNVYQRCTECAGTGLIKSQESQALMVMRILQRAVCNSEVTSVELAVTPAVAHRLANYQRKQISDLETATGRTVIVRAEPDLAGDEVKITCTNARGSEVAWDQGRLVASGKRKVHAVSLESFEKQAAGAAREQPAEPAAAPAPKDRAPGQGRRKRKKPGTPSKAAQPASKSRKKRKKKKTAPTTKAKTPSAEPAAKAEPEQKKKKSRRRGKRGGRKHKKSKTGPAAGQNATRKS